jgi:hypothetical protein
VLEVPEYTFEEFSEIAIKRLAKEDVDNSIAKVIAKKFGMNLVLETLEMS